MVSTDNLVTFFLDSDHENECRKNKKECLKKYLIKKRKYTQKSHHRNVIDDSNSLDERKIIVTQEPNSLKKEEK